MLINALYQIVTQIAIPLSALLALVKFGNYAAQFLFTCKEYPRRNCGTRSQVAESVVFRPLSYWIGFAASFLSGTLFHVAYLELTSAIYFTNRMFQGTAVLLVALLFVVVAGRICRFPARCPKKLKDAYLSVGFLIGWALLGLLLYRNGSLPGHFLQDLVLSNWMLYLGLIIGVAVLLLGLSCLRISKTKLSRSAKGCFVRRRRLWLAVCERRPRFWSRPKQESELKGDISSCVLGCSLALVLFVGPSIVPLGSERLIVCDREQCLLTGPAQKITVSCDAFGLPHEIQSRGDARDRLYIGLDYRAKAREVALYKKEPGGLEISEGSYVIHSDALAQVTWYDACGEISRIILIDTQSWKYVREIAFSESLPGYFELIDWDENGNASCPRLCSPEELSSALTVAA